MDGYRFSKGLLMAGVLNTILFPDFTILHLVMACL
jgi:hypothetical protein